MMIIALFLDLFVKPIERTQPTQERTQNQTCLNYAERQGGKLQLNLFEVSLGEKRFHCNREVTKQMTKRWIH